jgi:phage replication O-like protein O
MMPNPQIENGHLDLANELVEALSKLRMSGQEWQVLLVIWRKTYCWHKLSDTIALSQFQISTGLPKSNICRALKKLLSKKIIAIIKKDNADWTEYRFNKHYLEWEPLPKKIRGLSKKIIGVTKIDNDRYQNRDPQKKTISKETLSKEKEHTPRQAGLAYSPAFLKFYSTYPGPRKHGRIKPFQAWKKALKLHGLTEESLLEQCLNALVWQIKSEDWTKEDGQFIPAPEVYLNGARWEQEPYDPKEAAKKAAKIKDQQILAELKERGAL